MSDNNTLKAVPLGVPIVARFAKTEGKLYVATNTIRKWYAEKRLNFDHDMNLLEQAGTLTARNKKMTLTKGTLRDDRIQTRCFWFDLSKVGELIEVLTP